MNNPYEGGGFHFCPKALNDDGQLDVIVIHGLPKLVVLMLLPTAYKGVHVHFPGVEVYQCEHVRIKTEPSRAIHTDGEPIFPRKEITAEIQKKQIRVIVG